MVNLTNRCVHNALHYEIQKQLHSVCPLPIALNESQKYFKSLSTLVACLK